MVCQNRRPTPTINQSRTRDSNWNRKGWSWGKGGGAFTEHLIWKLCCCALYQPVGVFKQAHMVVATSFGKGGWVGGWARARISHSQYWVELRRRALKLSFQAQQKPSIWPLLKLRTSLLCSPLADWASWSRSNSINSVNPCHLRVLHFFSCLT